MRLKPAISCSASMLLIGSAPSAFAQAAATPASPANASDSDVLPTIVVTGIRASLATAQNLKERAPQEVDAIVAEDIGKLPDLNTAETVARIPGVQVYREGGEAQNVLVRGLPFFTTTYNGREIFTAETRVVALQDFPSSNIAALEVYKTATADLVAPGIAGIVNVRSRKPFDFEGAQFSGSAWALGTRQGDHVSPNFNILGTDRWTTDAGELGILAEGSWQDMRYLDAEISNTDFLATNSTFNGQSIRLPDIQRLFYRSGTRGRPSANVQLQFKPNSSLELYAEGLWQGFRNDIDDRLLEVPLYLGSFSAVQFRPGTNLVNSGTVTGSPGNLFSFQGATYNRTDTYQMAGGTKFTSGAFKLNLDVARSMSTFRGNTESVDRVFNGTPTVNFNNAIPSFSVSGVNFTDPSGQRFQGLYEENQRSAGRDWQARADAQYDFGDSPVRNIQAGIRYADRDAQRNYGNRYAYLLPLGINQTALPLQFGVFHGYDFQPTYQWVAPTYDSVHDNVVTLRQFVANACKSAGLTDPGCTSYITTYGGPVASPLLFDATERQLEGYGQVNFGFGSRVSGTAGVRVQNAKLSLPNVPSGGGTVNIHRDDTEWMPDASLLFKFDHGVQGRLSASRTVTRPEFEQLGPVTFGAPPSGGVGTPSNPYVGGGGNPYLQPFTSRNYDASLEYYFARAGFAALAVFHRDLDKFIVNSTQEYNDPTLGVVQINGPINSQKGRIDGVEAQEQVFLDALGLPEWTKMFGIQGTLTYLDFKLQQKDASGNLAYLPYYDQFNGVSKWNYNLVGIVESGPLSARLSFSGRDSFPASYQNRGDDIYIEPGHPANRLDLSMQYQFFRATTVFFDWMNIAHTPFRQDFSSARAGLPRADYVRYLRYDESTISLGMRFKL